MKDEIKAEMKLYCYVDLSSLMDSALLLEEKNLALNKKSKVKTKRNEWRNIGSKFQSTWNNPKFKKEEIMVSSKEREE